MLKVLPNLIRVSTPSEAFASVRGPLNQFKIVRDIHLNKGILRRWTVFSQGKRPTLTKYLFGKWLWDSLSKSEMEMLLTLPEATKDILIFNSLKAVNNGTSKITLRYRIETNPFGLESLSRRQYLGIKGSVNFFLIEETVSLRKTPKYSGYARHHNDKGSLGLQREELFPEVVEPFNDVLEETLYKYLTVGEIRLFAEEFVFRPDEANKQKRK